MQATQQTQKVRGIVMIKITMSNAQEVKWSKEEYDNYMYDGKCFIIIKDGKWAGFYNLDAVISIVVKE